VVTIISPDSTRKGVPAKSGTPFSFLLDPARAVAVRPIGAAIVGALYLWDCIRGEGEFPTIDAL
jgi:hypothetical protein